MPSIPYGDATHGENALWADRRQRPTIFLLLQFRDAVLADSDLDQHGRGVAVDGASGVGLGPRPGESVSGARCSPKIANIGARQLCVEAAKLPGRVSSSVELSSRSESSVGGLALSISAFILRARRTEPGTG
jgi:hypothetical protein